MNEIGRFFLEQNIFVFNNSRPALHYILMAEPQPSRMPFRSGLKMEIVVLIMIFYYIQRPQIATAKSGTDSYR